MSTQDVSKAAPKKRHTSRRLIIILVCLFLLVGVAAAYIVIAKPDLGINNGQDDVPQQETNQTEVLTPEDMPESTQMELEST